MITAFLQFFGKFLLWLYESFHSYALALIVFTLLTKLVLFPLTYKGKKSMMQTTALNGEIQRLQKQYGKDRERLNAETQALYEREGVNPMSGCLWSFLPLPILMGLYYIIRRPMLYMMCLTNEQIDAAVTAVQNLGIDIGTTAVYQEMKVASLLGDPKVYDAVAAAVGDGASKLAVIDFHWLGIDLASTPTWKFWTLDLNWASIGLFLIPIVVTIVNFGYSQLSQRTNKLTMNQPQKDDSGNNSMEQTTKTMNIIMPLMYLWFGYVMPAGMCVYMIFNAVFMALQELICAGLLRGKFQEMEEARQRRAAEAKEQERQRKAEIAARRAEQQRNNKNRKNTGKKKKGSDGKSKDRPTEDSRVGVRAFARGRAYDPTRYPVTSYRDPQDVLDEAALEAALAKNKKGRFQDEAEDTEKEAPQAVEQQEVVEPEVTAPIVPDEETPEEPVVEEREENFWTTGTGDESTETEEEKTNGAE